jgi:glycosyltransferase involved in cell wall biosynthesis
MVINFVLTSIGASGGIDVVYKYVDMLTERGHDVCVYKEIQASNMHRYDSKAKNLLHQAYCTLKAYIQKKKWKQSVDCFVWKLTDKTVRDADVIIATAWPTAYKVSGLSSSKGRKYYFVQDYEIWDNAEWTKKSYMLQLSKIVISTWINKCLKRDLGIGPFPVVYNGLDTTIYQPASIEKRDKEISFLMLNHTLPKKGVENGLQVFERVKKKYPNSKLRMFGMCDNSNLPDYVEYYHNPSKQKIVELYSMSDIFIFPSIEEGWGLTPLEAMACGCIVAGTNTGFVLDLGVHEKNMMISEPGDISKMVRNVVTVIEDKKLAQIIKKNVQKTIVQLDWNRSADKMVKILHSDL